MKIKLFQMNHSNKGNQIQAKDVCMGMDLITSPWGLDNSPARVWMVTPRDNGNRFSIHFMRASDSKDCGTITLADYELIERV